MLDYRPQYTALYLKRDSYALYSGGEWGFRPDGSEDFTLTIWFWPDNANARLLDSDGVMTLDLLEDRLVFWLKGYTDLVCIADHYPLVRHEWNHVTIAYSQAGQIFFYINGMQSAVYSIFQGTPAKKWDSILFCPGMEGYLRSVQFFNRRLSDEEVDQVKRAVEGAPAPVRWFDFETAVPQELVTGAPITLAEGAAVYSLGDGLFCDTGAGFYPLDGDSVNPGAHQDAPYTVQAWISIYSTEQNYAILLMNGRHTLDCGMVLYLEKEEAGYCLCAGRGAHTHEENILRSSHLIPPRSWHNVAVTYDGADMRLYIDGELEGIKTKSEMIPFTEQMSFGILRIGTDDLPGLSDGEGCFHGALGNITVWNRALAAADLNAYADNPPQADEVGLAANYTFSRYVCCNLVNGFEVSTAGVDTSKICRNPISGQPIKLHVPKQLPQVEALPHLHGKSAKTLHRERAAALPDAQAVLRAILGEDSDQCEDTLLAELQQELALLRTGNVTRPFYLSEPLGDGTYQFYLVSDQIYPAGVLAPRSQKEFTAWLIRFVSTLTIDVLSIYCSLPQSVTARVPQAFQKTLLNERAVELFGEVKDAGFKKLVATACKYLMGGGLLSQMIHELQRDGILLLGANLVTLAASFLVKAGSAWGWITVVARVIFLMVDLYALYQEMPKLLGAELVQLRFPTGTLFVPAVSAPGVAPAPHWKDGQRLDDASPVVCCLRQARGREITVSAQFTVFTDGSYNITATGTDDFPLGKIEETNVPLKAGKDGSCTVQLTFTQDRLTETGIGAFTTTLQWTIQGGLITRKQDMTIRLFLIYDIPQNPWGEKSGFGTPWTEVLTVACNLAKGTTGDTDVQWQSDLVKSLICGIWSCCTGYAEEPVYVSGTSLKLTSWLTDLHKENALKLHAQDCAALLVALGNLLGCGLASVLLRGAAGKAMTTRSVLRIGSGDTPTAYKLLYHETVMALRGMVPYFSDPCYQIPANPEQAANPLVMLPFYTEGAETGFCNVLFSEPTLCEISDNQRAIGNGRRTIL